MPFLSFHLSFLIYDMGVIITGPPCLTGWQIGSSETMCEHALHPHEGCGHPPSSGAIRRLAGELPTFCPLTPFYWSLPQRCHPHCQLALLSLFPLGLVQLPIYTIQTYIQNPYTQSRLIPGASAGASVIKAISYNPHGHPVRVLNGPHFTG